MEATLLSGALITTLALATFFDLRYRRIPNPLTVGGFLVALAIRAALGQTAILDGLAAGGVALVIALPLLALRAFGGGDAKLLVAVGAYLGPDVLPAALLYIALTGGALAFYTTKRLGLLPRVLANCGALVANLVTFGRRGRRPPELWSSEAIAVPYGLAIAIGSLVAWTTASVWP